MNWKSFQPISGLKVVGDKTRWPTILPLKPLYIALHWREVALMQVEDADVADGYYVGFTDKFGWTMIRTDKVTTPMFAALIGHEDCEFFAVRSLKDPQPLALKLIFRGPRSTEFAPKLVTRI